MTGVVLDASALLALILDEPGGERVSPHLDGALMSTVNFAEVAGHFTRLGASRDTVEEKLRGMQPTLVEASTDHALDAAALLPLTRNAGLSLGDRFCLALARAKQSLVLTADRAWAGVEAGVKIEFIR